ncbi:MAG: M1 family metallopeptidase [Thermoanaerobaculia bacterium]
MDRAATRCALAFALTGLAAGPALAAAEGPDPHSYSRPGEVSVTHLALDLSVDFPAHRLVGSAVLTLDRHDSAAPLVLDTRDLDISSVHFDSGLEARPFQLDPAAGILGSRLTIPLAAATRSVRIVYRTSPDAAAVQWLEPSQTAGGKRPFLHPVAGDPRPDVGPVPGLPGVRMTYEATIRAPKDLLAVMSATNPVAKSADGIYRFAMTRPIPSYFSRLAVGDLEFRPLGDRAGVYAEPTVVGKAAWELADTEKMIVAAEKLYGPYRWERYDILVLPPSFPFGGMENPRLTFATPTILAGDRSLVSLVAHELAHSWSGNLVTNATWNDFWLNEGFTTYFETRIMEAVYGRDYSEMLATLSRQELDAFVRAAEARPRSTWLFADTAGTDPDDAVGPIAYDKGYFFLRALEEAAGRPAWDAFLRLYFDQHAFQSMTTARFVEILRRDLLASDPKIARKVDIDAWIYGPGLPASAPQPTTPAFATVDRAVRSFEAGSKAAALETGGWVTHQWQRFLRELPEKLTAAQLADLDAAFRFTSSGNAEILFDWFRKTIAADYAPAYPAIEAFLKHVGRRKFVAPIYRALAATPAGLERAKRIYAEARPGYHSVTRGTVDAMLDFKG